jgi:hypothetical protein
MSWVRAVPWRLLISSVIVSVAALAPIIHLAAIRRILRVSKTHDLSLTTSLADFEEDKLQERIDWRWRLAWREPQRIRTTLRNWYKAVFHWFFFAGSVQDRLQRQFHSRRESEARKQGVHVLERFQASIDMYPSTFRPDRDQWKQYAMDILARKHQNDHDQQKFDDPLGIAVHQTFGIGLGYNFDHMSELYDGEKPSLRRLQARAAKSAVRRVQDIYNTTNARVELDRITDPEERELRAQQMQKEAQEEIDFLAKRLTELVPTDLALEDPTLSQIERYAINDFEKISPHEYVIRRGGDRLSVVERLLKDTRESAFVDYDDLSASIAAEIEEYSRRLERQRKRDIQDNDGDEIKTVFV